MENVKPADWHCYPLGHWRGRASRTPSLLKQQVAGMCTAVRREVEPVTDWPDLQSSTQKGQGDCLGTTETGREL